jgi:CRISPR-associated protein Csn2
MMKFKHSEWENRLWLSPQKLNYIAVERQDKLYEYAVELFGQCDGNDGRFVLSRNNDMLVLEKTCETISDFVGLKLNGKKTANLLLKKCMSTAAEPEFAKKLAEINTQLSDFCSQIIENIGYSVTLEEDFDCNSLLKLFSIKIEENYTSLLEKLVSYINLTVELKGIKVVVLPLSRSYLDDKDIAELFYHCRYQDICLLLLENQWKNNIIDARGNSPEQGGLIIDCDLCEMLVNSQDL